MTESTKPLIKPFWKSKTVLFNFIGALILWVAGHEVLGIDAQILALIQSGVNIVLRFLTATPVAGGKKAGFARFPVMITVFILSAMLLLAGCATFNNLFPPPAKPVCDRPEAAESVICQEFRERDLEPEQYQDLILDVVAIGALVEPQAVAMAKRFLARVRMGLTSNPLLTLGELFTWVQNNEQYYKAIASIFSRRLPWALEVDELLTPFDFWLVEEHLKNIEELL